MRIVPPSDGSTWLPAIMGQESHSPGPTLEEVCVRISCGVATGADEVFVKVLEAVEPNLRRFAYPTIAGREMGDSNESLSFGKLMLIPYELDGRLIPENRLGQLRAYLSQPAIRSRLEQRTCVRRKPWYAFHDATPPLRDILQPKILCKDITERPKFWIDWEGKLVPRHSVYYIVPRHASQIESLCEHLNSEAVERWLDSHCQRVANGFLEAPEPCAETHSATGQILLGQRVTAKHSAKRAVKLRREDVRTRQLQFGR